ncbi:MAG: type II toxin-antitoxin system HicA family toxin [Candidatus Kuenenia sp.]|nr:type II toxin-antitoxin system HicA family toxin [Candidatus Kuenenia sp.]
MSPKFPAVTSNEVSKIGFKFKRQSGSSHAIYYKQEDKRRVNIPIHSGKIIKRKTLKSIILSAGLTIEEFENLKKS